MNNSIYANQILLLHLDVLDLNKIGVLFEGGHLLLFQIIFEPITFQK